MSQHPRTLLGASLIGASLIATLLTGCGEDEAPPPRFRFTFSVTSDGAPLEGVSIAVDQNIIGTTNAEGVVQTDLTGAEGQPATVAAQCPEGYRAADPQPIVLRQMVTLDPAAQERGLAREFECPPEFRDTVVIVRAGHPDLPVYVDGTEVTRTDASGVAHVHRRMAPNNAFQMMIATAAMPLLRPQDPTHAVTVPDRDSIDIFSPEFRLEEPPRRRRRRRAAPPPRPSLPVRIGSHR